MLSRGTRAWWSSKLLNALGSVFSEVRVGQRGFFHCRLDPVDCGPSTDRDIFHRQSVRELFHQPDGPMARQWDRIAGPTGWDS